jgi:hypothetical protein
VQDAASRTMLTMVLSEARGLSLFFGYPRGRVMGDSMPKHKVPISLTDTHPRTERLQNPTVHHRRNTAEMESLLLRDAQAAGRCSCWASNFSPFTQMVILIAAIFRAKVRRAMVGLILFSTPSHITVAQGSIPLSAATSIHHASRDGGLMKRPYRYTFPDS